MSSSFTGDRIAVISLSSAGARSVSTSSSLAAARNAVMSLSSAGERRPSTSSSSAGDRRTDQPLVRGGTQLVMSWLTDFQKPRLLFAETTAAAVIFTVLAATHDDVAAAAAATWEAARATSVAALDTVATTMGGHTETEVDDTATCDADVHADTEELDALA